MTRSSRLIIYDIFTVSVGTNEQRIKAFYLRDKKKQGLKYLNTKRIKTHRRPCCADLCMRMDLPLDKKLWKIRTGPPGRGAVEPRSPRAAGPPGRGGPWATDRWAVGPLGRGGPWAVGRGPLGRGPAFSKTHYRGTPTWQLHTGLCKFVQNISTNI